MRKEYDFSVLKRRKVRVTINLDPAVVRYFKERAKAEGIGYQTLINETLKKVAENERICEEVKTRLLNDESFISNVAQKVASMEQP